MRVSTREEERQEAKMSPHPCRGVFGTSVPGADGTMSECCNTT